METSNRTVAIVGSGPAGLFAAWALQRDGFDVTIFEKVSPILHGSYSRDKLKSTRLIRKIILQWMATHISIQIRP